MIIMDVDKKWQEFIDGSQAARNELILHYMPLVKSAAYKMSKKLPSTVERADLESYGTFGLIDAIHKYDIKRGIKFETYAPTRINGAIYDGLRSMDWVPRAVRSQSKILLDMIQRLSSELQRAPTREEICYALGWSKEEYENVRGKAFTEHAISLNDTASSKDDETSQSEVIDTIASMGGVSREESPSSFFEFTELKEELTKVLKTLNEKEQAILKLYYFEGLKFTEISNLFNVSESRICQIHMKAVENIRKGLTNEQ